MSAKEIYCMGRAEYLAEYNGEMVSHGEKYRKVYLPAYRVILEKFAENLQ